jgi:hypothetical protein
MKTFPLDRAKFYLLPSTNPPRELVSVHDATFDLWRQVWKDEFEKLKYEAKGVEDDFGRQDLIASVTIDGQPIAAHLYTFFSIDTRAAREHSYLKNNYPEIYFEKLRELGVRNVMSMEYFTVSPDWRRGQCDVPIGTVLVGLACQTMKHLNQDAAIAPARRDYKVHEVVYSWGGEPIVANVINHGVPCDLLALRADKLAPHPKPEVQRAFESLWKGHELVHQWQPGAEIVPFHRKAA